MLDSAWELCVDNVLEVPLAEKLFWCSLYSLGDAELAEDNLKTVKASPAFRVTLVFVASVPHCSKAPSAL